MSYDEKLKCFVPIRYIPKFPSTNRPATYSGEKKTRSNNDINFKAYLTSTGKRKSRFENNEQHPLSFLSSKIQRNKYSYLPQNSYTSENKSLLTSSNSDISQIEPLNDQNTYILRSALKSSTKFKRPNQTVKRVLFSPKSTPKSNKCLSKSNTATKTENLSAKTKLSIISESPKNKTDASTQTENDSIKIDKSIQTDELGATCLNYSSPNYSARNVHECVNTPDNSLTCFENNDMLLSTNPIKIILTKPSIDEINEKQDFEVNKTPTVQETLEKIKQISEDLKKTINEDMLKINDYFIDSKKKIDYKLKLIEDEIDNIIQSDKENVTPRSLRSSAAKPKNTNNLRIEILKKSTLQHTPVSRKKYLKLDKSLQNYEKLKNIIPLETPKINKNKGSVVTFKTSKAQLSEKCFSQIQDLERSPTFFT